MAKADAERAAIEAERAKAEAERTKAESEKQKDSSAPKESGSPTAYSEKERLVGFKAKYECLSDDQLSCPKQ